MRIMDICLVAVVVATLGCLISVTEQNEISYKCTDNNVLIIQNKSNDFVKMHCAVPKICGEIRNCLKTFSTGLCNGKGHYLMGVDERPDKNIGSTCCQYSPPVKSHSNDRCVTQEVRDRSSNSGSGQDTNNLLPPRHGSGQEPPERPSNGIPSIPSRPSSSGSNSGSLPERPQNSDGSLPWGPNNKQSFDNGGLQPNDNGIVDLSLFQLTYKQAPVEIVKGIERIPNGFRVTSCFIECEQSTTTVTTVGSTVSLSSTTLSTAAHPVVQTTVRPGGNDVGGNNGGTGCRTMSPTTVSLVNNIKQHKAYVTEGIPGFQEPGFYCDTARDDRCLNKCLMVLQSRFKSATCDLSNNNCLCRQDANKHNFDENLKSMGLHVNDPHCKQIGNHGSSSTRTSSSSSGTTGHQGSTKPEGHIGEGGSTDHGGRSGSTESGNPHHTGSTVPHKITHGGGSKGVGGSSHSASQHHTEPQPTHKENGGSTHHGGQHGGSTKSHDHNNGHDQTVPVPIPNPQVGKGFRAGQEGAGGAGGCFSSDMSVQTRNGTKRMDQLKIGDEVINRCYATFCKGVGMRTVKFVIKRFVP